MTESYTVTESVAQKTLQIAIGITTDENEKVVLDTIESLSHHGVELIDRKPNGLKGDVFIVSLGKEPIQMAYNIGRAIEKGFQKL